MILAVWLPILLTTTLHYTTSHEHQWVHDILRRIYYLPIVIAALRSGLLGGLISSAIVAAAYVPHAFFMQHHFDPARGLEKILEIGLYFTVGAVAGILSDRERRRASQLVASLEEQKKLLHELVRAGRLGAMGEMVAGIAHEIKNPLHSLAGTAEVIGPVIPEDSEEHRMWELHRQEISRLGRIADRFLSFASPSPIEKVSLDLRDVAVRLVDLVGAQARSADISLEYRPPEEPVLAVGDMDQLAQVGLNIVVNAIAALGGNSGRIEIAVGHDDEIPFMRIENDGPPIESEVIDRLFDPFSSGSGGTGLGLSIASRIAQQHGGSLEYSVGGLGVLFTLRLEPHSKP